MMIIQLYHQADTDTYCSYNINPITFQMREWIWVL